MGSVESFFATYKSLLCFEEEPHVPRPGQGKHDIPTTVQAEVYMCGNVVWLKSSIAIILSAMRAGFLLATFEPELQVLYLICGATCSQIVGYGGLVYPHSHLPT